jgi:hypothetical protein
MPRISRLNRNEIGPSSVAIFDRTLREPRNRAAGNFFAGVEFEEASGGTKHGNWDCKR